TALSDLKARIADSGLQLRKTKTLAGAGVLSALALALNQLTIMVSQFLEIGFSFLAAAACGFLYGPLVAGIAGVVTDLLGYVMRPNGGFFIGFVLSEFVTGFLYGCFLYKRPVTLLRTFLACLSVVVVVNFFLTPLWLNIMYGNAFIITSVRLIKNCIKLPIDVALMYTLLKAVEKHQKK
ncbi:MAG: folate family ECF transporter S component, partial [Ruthenibacterium sp.]